MRDWAKLHADISKSRSFADLANEDARAGLLFLMMLPRADVLGIVDAHPVIFRGEVCPRLALTESEIDGLISLIQKHEMATLYSDPKGNRWLWVHGYGKYQDVRWTHVGPPNRPLPENWKPPVALQKHLADKPGSPVSLSIVELQSNYCSVTVELPEDYVAPCERAQEGDVYTSDVEGDVEGEKRSKAHAETPPACPDCGIIHGSKDPSTMDSDERIIDRAFEVMTGARLSCEYATQKALVESGEKKGKPLRGIGGIKELVGSTADALIEAIISHDECPKLPEGKKPWGWFSKTLREAITQHWKWEDAKPTSSPTEVDEQFADYPRMGEQ